MRVDFVSLGLLTLALCSLLPAQPSTAEPADVLLREGLALAHAGQWQEAEQRFLQGRQRFPDDVRFGEELAGVAYRLHRTGAAKRYLREVVRREPSRQYANDFLANLFLLDGNLPAALRYWNRVGKPVLRSARLVPTPQLNPVLRERLLAASAGQVLSLPRLEQTEANLARIGVFADWRLELAPGADQRFDFLVHTTPRAQPLRGWLGWTLPLVSGLPYQQVNLDLVNLRQRAINLTSLWRWDSEKRRISVALQAPLGSWQYRLLLDGREEHWDLRRSDRAGREALDTPLLRRFEAGGDASRDLTERLRWTIGGRVAIRRFQRGDGSVYFANSWSAEVRNRLNARVWSWPDRRVRLDGWALLRTGRIFTDISSRLVSAEAGISGSWRPQAKGDTYELQTQMRTGGTVGGLPLDELFILGMERDNDLWFRGVAGTRDRRKGNAPLGTRYALIRTEADRKLLELPFVRLAAGPFFDAGTIGGASGRFGSDGWLTATGLQMKVRVIGVTFTAVYGRNLSDGRGVFYTGVSR